MCADDASTADAESLAPSVEARTQDARRRQFRAACEAGGPKHYVSDSDTFDAIPGGMLVRRNNHTTPLLVVPDGQYGA